MVKRGDRRGSEEVRTGVVHITVSPLPDPGVLWTLLPLSHGPAPKGEVLVL